MMQFSKRMIRSMVVFALILSGMLLFPMIYKIPFAFVGLSLLLAFSYYVIEPMLMDVWARAFEEKGIITFAFDSSGFFVPLISKFTARGKVEIPKLKGVKNAETVFKKDLVNYLGKPQEATLLVDDDGNLYLKIRRDQLTNARFSAIQRPVFLYNMRTATFIDKEFLDKAETKLLKELLLMNLYDYIKDLHMNIKHFLRYVVDMLPHGEGLKKWLMWILIGTLIVIGIIFAMKYFRGTGVTQHIVETGKAVMNNAGASTGQIITPR